MHNALRRPLLRSFRNGARSGGSPASGATLRAGVELLLVALLALQAARLIVRGALDRRESRGGHYRADHPETAAEARHTRMRLRQPEILAAE